MVNLIHFRKIENLRMKINGGNPSDQETKELNNNQTWEFVDSHQEENLLEISGYIK